MREQDILEAEAVMDTLNWIKRSGMPLEFSITIGDKTIKLEKNGTNAVRKIMYPSVVNALELALIEARMRLAMSVGEALIKKGEGILNEFADVELKETATDYTDRGDLA